MSNPYEHAHLRARVELELRPGALIMLDARDGTNRSLHGLTLEVIAVVRYSSSAVVNYVDAADYYYDGRHDDAERFRQVPHLALMRGWQLIRPAPVCPDYPPAPSPRTAVEVLAHIERVMAKQDKRRADLVRADHFALCTGCKACRDHR